MSHEFVINITEVPSQIVYGPDTILEEQLSPVDAAHSDNIDWGVSEWIDVLNSLTQDCNRTFLASWRGPRNPLGARVLGHPIVRMNDFELLSTTAPDSGLETKIGYYKRTVEDGGASQDEQQMLIFVNDETLPLPQ